MAPRFVPRSSARFGSGARFGHGPGLFREGRLHRHRFGPTGQLLQPYEDDNDNVNEAPAGADVYGYPAGEPGLPGGGYGGRPLYAAPIHQPPQIIVLPDVRRRYGASRHFVPAPSVVEASPRRDWSHHFWGRREGWGHHFAYNRPAWIWPAAAYPSYAPYALDCVPVTLGACNDPPHSAIYNTPCGVRPYE